MAQHGKGRYALYGDSNCLDSSHQTTDCYSFLQTLVEWVAEVGIQITPGPPNLRQEGVEAPKLLFRKVLSYPLLFAHFSFTLSDLEWGHIHPLTEESTLRITRFTLLIWK